MDKQYLDSSGRIWPDDVTGSFLKAFAMIKQVFNWLAQKSDMQPTLGYIALRPFLGPSPVNEAIYNTARLRNGGRLVERTVFLASLFGAAAAVPAAAPMAATAFLVAGAAIAGKTVGILAGKAADFLIWDINGRVIPRREAAKNNPKP